MIAWDTFRLSPVPFSNKKFDNMIQGFLLSHFSTSARILDVGAGMGKYSDMLPNYTLDGVEIFEPFVEQYNLHSKYRNIYICHIADFSFEQYQYDLVIFGAVLEHLSIHEAQTVLKSVHTGGAKSFVTVPYLYPQGELCNNIYETHLQPDLTPNTMAKRYPDLHLLHRDDEHAIYIGPTNWA